MLYEELEGITFKPEPFKVYTTKELWTDKHISRKMLEFHLNENVDAASRNKSFIDKSVEWIISYFHINDSSYICDFGCGPGLYTTLLAKSGAEVTGIDFSERSIQYAKDTAEKKTLEIEYVLQDYLTYNTDKRFDLIIMIMCDFCVLSPAQRKELLKIFYKHLKPGGSILLDVYTLEYFRKKQEQSIYKYRLMDGFWSPKRYYGFQNTFKYNKEKVILDKYTIIERNKIQQIFNWSQCYSLETLKAEFEDNGFRIVDVYSDVSGNKLDKKSLEMAIVAKHAL